MQTLPHVSQALYQLTSLLDDLAGCDPDFDAAYDDLDREFAEFRIQLGNE